MIRTYPFFIKGGVIVKKEVIAIRRDMQPLEEVTIKERVKYNGFIQSIYLRFYAGQEEELKVLPYVVHKGQKVEHFFTFGEDTDNLLAGEDDSLSFGLTIPIELDDEIHVRITNTNDTYNYTAVCYIEVVYDFEKAGGK
jgi:hypothetical protein